MRKRKKYFMSITRTNHKEDVDRLTAVFKTTMGVFEIELYAKECPETVWNFVNLAESMQKTEKKGKYYDGLSFHRVIDEFMIQGGCPFGNGMGGPGYQFNDEFSSHLRHDSAGILSMANSGPNTNGSQFFITLVPTPHLDDRHSVFGKVKKGIDNIIKIGSVPVDSTDKPIEPVIIEEVNIER